MRIELETIEFGHLCLKVYSEDTLTTTRISSYITKKVEKPIVNDIHNLVIEVARYNGLSNLETVKNFVENSLTEKEIRELIKSLEN
jgi:hypothetical protein